MLSLITKIIAFTSTAAIRTHLMNATSSCSSIDALAKNLVVRILPDPPIVNLQADLIFEYDLPGADITGGTINYNAVINNFFPSQSTDDLCATRNPDSPCPIKGGGKKHIDTGKSTFPDVQSCSLTIIWKNQDGLEILCAKLDYSF